MSIKPKHAAVLTLLIFIIGIFATSQLGLYSTKTQKTPAVLDSAGYNGQYDPGDIRGSYTFSDISRLYGVPLSDLAAAFGQNERTAAVLKCKDIEALYADTPYEIGTASVRLFVAWYTNLPYEPVTGEYLPDTAASILLSKGDLSDERLMYLKDHTADAA